MRPVVVIGGGIAGLVAAFELKRRGHDVVVLEGADRAGGHIATSVEEGYRFELGPNAVLDREPLFKELVAALGLESRLVQASPSAKARFLCVRGALRPLPMGPKFFTSDLLSLRGRARLFAEVAAGKAAEDESIYSFGVRHLGEEATQTLLDPMVTGIFAGDLRTLSVRSCLPRLHQMEREHGSLVLALIDSFRRARREGRSPPMGGTLQSFRDGMEELPRALEGAMSGALRLGCRATRVDLSQSGVAVTLEDGERIDGRAAVLALPADGAAALFESSLPEAAGLMRQVPYAPLAVVHLGYSTDQVRGDLGGFGFLVPTSERLPILGTVFASSLFPGRAPSGHCLLTTMVGGAINPAMFDRPDEALSAIVHAELSRLLTISGPPAFARVVRVARAIPQYVVGSVARNESLRQLLERAGPVSLAGTAWNGVGVLEGVKSSCRLAERLAATS